MNASCMFVSLFPQISVTETMKDRVTGKIVRKAPRMFDIATPAKQGDYRESWAKRQLQKVTLKVFNA